MKFDKETIIVMFICAALIMGFLHFGPKIGLIPQRKDVETEEPVDIETESPDKIPGTPKDPKDPEDKDHGTDTVSTEDKDSSGSTGTIEIPEDLSELRKLETIHLSNELVKVEIEPNTGSLSSVVLLKHLNDDKETNVKLQSGIDKGALSVFPIEGKWKLLKVDVRKSPKTPSSVSVERLFKSEEDTFLLIQTWTLEENYRISYNIEIINKGEKELSFTDFMVSAGGLPPLKYITADDPKREKHIADYFHADDGKFYKIKPEEKKDHVLDANVGTMISVSNKYFTCILKPAVDKKFQSGTLFYKDLTPNITKFKKKQFTLETTGTIRIETEEGEAEKLNSGDSFKADFSYYAGPKELKMLKEFDPQAVNIMHLTFRIFEWIARLLLRSLIFLNGICGNYGLSIIVLTLIVKGLFWPVTHKANKSMKEMQKIQPMIQEIRKKYKDNPQKMNQKTMELYKTHKVNPVGGCLPMLMQLPVFFALFATLNGAIELRHESFLWASDLSRPDTIYTFTETFPLIGQWVKGFDINILILAMVGTMFLQQKLTPSTGNADQQRMMMMMMPAVMLFIGYSFPSGLTLYWTVSQVISIIQLLVNQRSLKKEKLKEKTA